MILMPSGCQGPIGANAARVLEKVGPKKKQQQLLFFVEWDMSLSYFESSLALCLHISFNAFICRLLCPKSG